MFHIEINGNDVTVDNSQNVSRELKMTVRSLKLLLSDKYSKSHITGYLIFEDLTHVMFNITALSVVSGDKTIEFTKPQIVELIKDSPGLICIKQ